MERDLTAKRLREVFKAPPREIWEPLLTKVKPGMTRNELLAQLTPEQRRAENISAAGSEIERYRLDHSWQLWCWYEDSGKVLKLELQPHIQEIWIAPPADFSGKWVTYFVNGQPSHVIEYRAGKYFGKFTANHSTGARSYVQYYGEDGIDGDDIGYFSSGKVSYRAQYSKGKAVGVWTWYNEQGEVINTKVH